jgi:hypothetical protein
VEESDGKDFQRARRRLRLRIQRGSQGAVTRGQIRRGEGGAATCGAPRERPPVGGSGAAEEGAAAGGAPRERPSAGDPAQRRRGQHAERGGGRGRTGSGGCFLPPRFHRRPDFQRRNKVFIFPPLSSINVVPHQQIAYMAVYLMTMDYVVESELGVPL